MGLLFLDRRMVLQALPTNSIFERIDMTFIEFLADLSQWIALAVLFWQVNYLTKHK